jgi:hypothetical protein
VGVDGMGLADGCRSRYECRDGGRRKVLVEKTEDALVVESRGGRGELDGEFGGGCGEEGWS